MKNNRYKKSMDKIRCSEEFRTEMTKKLSEPIDSDTEYADSVSDVEYAPKRNFIKYAVVGAAACFAIGGVGYSILGGISRNDGSDDKNHFAANSSIVETTGNEEGITEIAPEIPLEEITDIAPEIPIGYVEVSPEKIALAEKEIYHVLIEKAIAFCEGNITLFFVKDGGLAGGESDSYGRGVIIDNYELSSYFKELSSIYWMKAENEMEFTMTANNTFELGEVFLYEQCVYIMDENLHDPDIFYPATINDIEAYSKIYNALRSCPLVDDEAENTTEDLTENTTNAAEVADANFPPLSVLEELAGLDYSPETCDGLPEHILTTDDGTVYQINLTDKWVWRNGSEEAKLPETLAKRIYVLLSLDAFSSEDIPVTYTKPDHDSENQDENEELENELANKLQVEENDLIEPTTVTTSINEEIEEN